MKGLAIAGALAVTAIAALPAQSRAADLGIRVVIGNADFRASDWRGAGPGFRYGYDRGWRDGSEEGYKDARRRRDGRFWREDDFRDGDSGYRRFMGSRHEFVRGYRQGYAAGYRRAFAAERSSWRDRNWDRDRWDRRYRDRDDWRDWDDRR